MTKQEVLDYLDNVLHPIVSPDNWNVYSELYDMIEKLPSAEPVRHGKWIGYAGTIGNECSVCGKWIDVLQGTAEMNYCPNCGARMDADALTKYDQKAIDEEIERAWKYAETD